MCPRVSTSPRPTAASLRQLSGTGGGRLACPPWVTPRAPQPTVTPYGVPGGPGVDGKTAGQNDKTVRWTWNTPGDNGSAITRYREPAQRRRLGRPWHGHELLEPGTFDYNDTTTLSVRACNAGGCGAGSGAVNSRPAPAPPTRRPLKSVSRPAPGTPAPWGRAAAACSRATQPPVTGMCHPAATSTLAGTGSTTLTIGSRYPAASGNWYVMTNGPVCRPLGPQRHSRRPQDSVRCGSIGVASSGRQHPLLADATAHGEWALRAQLPIAACAGHRQHWQGLTSLFRTTVSTVSSG